MILYILIFALGAVAQYFGPWWLMPIVCFVLCFWKSETAKGAFTVAFAAISSFWIGYALFLHNATGGVMTQKITNLFIAASPHNAFLFAITAVIGGLVAGFAGLAGFYGRKAV